VDPARVPIDEDTPMRPASPYAVSKAAQDMLGWSYFLSYGMRIIRTRMFTYLNPRRADLFATAFARQVARIERGLQAELLHGNLDSVRTMLDVRDAMRAYWEALGHCEPGEAYNIGGATTMTVGCRSRTWTSSSRPRAGSRATPSRRAWRICSRIGGPRSPANRGQVLHYDIGSGAVLHWDHVRALVIVCRWERNSRGRGYVSDCKT